MDHTFFRELPWRLMTQRHSCRLVLLLLVFITLLCLPIPAVPNGTETIITTDNPGIFQENPSVSGTLIVWNSRDQINQIYAAHAYNLQTGLEYLLLPDPANPFLWQFAPTVYNDWIVWQQDDGVNYNIIAFNNNTFETIAIPAMPKGLADWSFSYLGTPSDNVLPCTNGTAVVWQDFTNDPHWGIYLYDLTLGSGGTPDPIIADPAYDQKSPAISGDYIVYENWSSGQSDIYLYFGENKTAIQISQFANDDLNPSIDGSRIVWQRNNATTGFNAIYLYDTGSGQTRQITPPGSQFNDINAKISGDRIVVQTDRGPGPAQVYMYTITGDPFAETWITPASPMIKYTPAISGSRIVWEDYRNGDGSRSDVYLLTLGPAETCPVADFTLSPSAVLQGDTVTFTAAGAQAGASAISHRLWNFSDGSPEEPAPGTSVSHTFSADGVFPVKLTVGNLKCRNVSVDTCSHRVFVNSPPVADFNAMPEYGLAPLTVQFLDTSCGGPLNWSWDFGDGNTSCIQNPSNIFTNPATEYTVTLTVNNTNAGYATSTTSKTIRTFMGGQNTAYTPVDGIRVDNRYQGQFLTYDSSVLPLHSPAPPAPYLVVYPPAPWGWENITFIASDSTGVVPPGPNQTYFANVSRFYLKTNDVIATTSGTPPSIGNNWGTSYQLNTTRYPQVMSLKTEQWEGAVPADWADFDYVATHATTPNLLRSIAYTVKITKPRLPGEGTAVINMSVGNAWVATTSNIYVIGVGSDAAGNRRGAIIPAEHLFSSCGLDYYEAEIPESVNYLSTFGLADLSGSGNPFQLITLSVTTHVEPPSPNPPAPASPGSGSDSDGGTSPGAATVGTAAGTPAPSPVPTQVQPAATAEPQTTAGSAITSASTLAAAKGPAPSPVTQQPQASPPTTAVSIFTSMVSWVASTVAGNAVVAALVVVTGLAVYLFKKG
jgi:beta propeller repeat protein